MKEGYLALHNKNKKKQPLQQQQKIQELLKD
jgi:hypothetical protein